MSWQRAVLGNVQILAEARMRPVRIAIAALPSFAVGMMLSPELPLAPRLIFAIAVAAPVFFVIDSLMLKFYLRGRCHFCLKPSKHLRRGLAGFDSSSDGPIFKYCSACAPRVERHLR